MTEFQKKVERYLQCDKRTLAEMLALKEVENGEKKLETDKEPTITDGNNPIKIPPVSEPDAHPWITPNWPPLPWGVGDFPPYRPFSPYAEPTVWYSAATTTDADLKEYKV